MNKKSSELSQLWNSESTVSHQVWSVYGVILARNVSGECDLVDVRRR